MPEIYMHTYVGLDFKPVEKSSTIFRRKNKPVTKIERLSLALNLRSIPTLECDKARLMHLVEKN